MIRGLISLYSPKYPKVLVYMLQNTEYFALPYLKWYWQTGNFSNVMYRRELVRTKAARLLLLALRLGMFSQIVAGLTLIAAWQWHDLTGGLAFGLALILAYPVVWAHAVVVPLSLGRLLIVKPRQYRRIHAARQIFNSFNGVKIAVAGSYGKTSMKELLATVLSEGKTVAATPANKNVAISHALFAQKISGDEDVLILEYGEGAPGDVARFAANTMPTHAVITGLAAAHLDKYKTVHRAGKDIFSLNNVVAPSQVYVNGESPDALPFVTPGNQLYSERGALGWKVSNIKISLEGISFSLQKGKTSMDLHSKLLGRHQIGPLSFVAAYAAELGMKPADIKAGVAKTEPFEHRMEPYQLSGAWIIDDTYNGNLEGIRAGAKLLHELSAKRKIYVTPGLVDQGKESAAIHEDMGKIIASAHPDIVVLMQHTVTRYIQKGLTEAGYKGEVIVETDPLDFYTNLKVFVATGDLVLMQNDWPDNYL